MGRIAGVAVTGRHEAPPVGSGAREATASPYAGKRRAGELVLIQCSYPRCSHSVSAGNLLIALGLAQSMGYTEARDGQRLCREHGERRAGLDPDPPRCWSCGHPYDAGCECTCCNDGEPGDE
jgi:hypothetical protein